MVIRQVLQDPAVLPENVYNMDETGVMLCKLGSVKVLVGKDDPRDYRGIGMKRTMVTAIECISANGRSLLPMIIWPATTHRSNWTAFPTPGWHYACSESGYTNSRISLEWLTRVFDPQTKGQADQKPRVLICDGFGTHETLEILEFCLENNITLCRLPSHTSHKLQPCNMGVFAPLKAAYQDQAKRLYQGGASTVGKEHFTSLYTPAREKAFTRKNITAAWAASGLFPFNPDRVLRSILKPQSPSDSTAIDEVRANACSHDKVPTPVTPITPAAPMTPMTPVSAEALTALHDLIKEDAHSLDVTSIQRLQKRMQKLANAAHISFAERALLYDHNQFLSRMNDEDKKRRLSKSVIMGRAKVMSYEDIEEAREKRAAKENTKSKRPSGQKRRLLAVEEDDFGPGRGPEVARSIELPQLGRAPVARMY